MRGRCWTTCRLLLWAIALLFTALGSVPVYAEETVTPPVEPPPLLVVREARLPVRLLKVDVQAEVLGSAAHTRIELVFFNPNQQILEGELQFPLFDGQRISGFSLDIDGVLRPAVPVEKAKGRQVFEDVIRQQVDPALLEQTVGNNYRLRVYPLPQQGTRRVVLELDQLLSSGLYQLPLQFAKGCEMLQLRVHSATPPTSASKGLLGAIPLPVSADNDNGTLIEEIVEGSEVDGMLEVSFPAQESTLTSVGQWEGQRYFYVEATPEFGGAARRPNPDKLGLVWDASGSGADRDHDRELALLDAYFRHLEDVDVTLVVARDRAEAPLEFEVDDGDWQPLRDYLQGLAYDGATAVSALTPPADTELNLLFSDGLTTYGEGSLHAGDVPLYAVSASAGADLPRLRSLAEKTGGKLVDLLRDDIPAGLELLTLRYPQLLALNANGATALVAVADGERLLRLAGLLKKPQAEITVVWRDAEGDKKEQRIEIRPQAVSVSSFAARRWADLKLQTLQSEYALNRATIQRIGQSFGLATPGTSLIVLDRVEDYVEYEIEPPAEMREQYQRLVVQRKVARLQEERSHLDKVASRFAEKQKWWKKDFTKDAPQPPAARKQALEFGAAPMERAVGSAPRDRMMAAPVQRETGSPPPAAPMAMSAVREEPMDSEAAASSADMVVAAPASIRLQKWQPDAPYSRRLREADARQLYRIYLDERPGYTNSTAFFLDVADILFERQQPHLALRVLSNLAEMDLGNRHILRILAYRLLQADQVEAALPLLQEVRRLAPDEPQSWRDLGLAYAAAGKYQLAVDSLWQVVAKPWHNRFPDIELIALAELNATIARAPKGSVDASAFDARLLHNLPLALRAVLSWDADNTDIDLWVTDPNGEKTYYQNPLSYQGGKLSRDFTGGYGPEEFSLRVAKPGTYRIQAQFYGHRQQVVAGATTLMLKLSTDFGTENQHDEDVILRLKGTKEVVDVGTFTVK